MRLISDNPQQRSAFFKRLSLELLGALIIIVGVTFLAFLLSYLSPTDPAIRYFTDKGMIPTETELATKRHELGLDLPFWQQYSNWIVSMLHGDMGNSYRTGNSVFGSLMFSLPYTLALTFTSMTLTLLIAVPLGLLCAKRKDSALDNAVRAFSYLFCSIPTFLVALVLLYIFSVQLHVLPTSSKDAIGLIMPTLALAIPLAAWYVRQVRTIALEQYAKPYVDGLRSRGISEHDILFKHILKNSLVPILALVGISLGGLLGGSAIIECIFAWPGVGNLSVSAINSRDYAVVQGYALLMAIVYLVMNWILDAVYRVIDPRIGGR